MSSPIIDPLISNPALPEPPAKEFRCTWTGCSKSFSRAEHLHRHALNHNEANGTACERCSAVFKRKDLLDRHKARHKEKDEEAGGEGLGRLLTRKRLWRDSTGTIVAKRRPEHEKKRKHRRSEGDISPSGQLPVLQSYSPLPFHNIVPLSPPGSSEPVSNTSEPPDSFGSEPLGSPEHGQLSAAVEDEPWPQPNVNENIFQEISEESFDFLCNASWGAQQFPTELAPNAPSDDIFTPDTASSFNMPFTTVNYYSWLFGNEPWPASESRTGHEYQSPRINPSLHDPPRSSWQAPAGLPSVGPYETRLPPIGQEGLGSGFGPGFPNMGSINAVPPFSEFLAMSRTPETSWGNPARDTIDRGRSGTPYRHHGLGSAGDRYVLTPTDSRSSQDFQGYVPPAKKARRLPFIDEIAREGILRLVEQAHPKTPDGLELSTDHPLLSLASLQHFCDLFFGRFNTTYPLLHQATFDPRQIDRLLLAAVIQLGATYSSTEDHLFAICFHNVMRGQIIGHAAFNTRPTLWILQTILLVECFGKSRAGQLQHDMSHLFHGLLINLIRRSDCQSARCPRFTDDMDLDSRWRAEVDAEERRRLALLCFMWDTQHAVLFSQSLCMNAAELKVSMPWDSALWDADSSEEWRSISAMRQPPPMYMSVLRSYINPESESRPANLNGFSRVLALHGLMSIAWDLNRRDQTSLGIATGGKDEAWQSRIARSYDNWKTDYDKYINTLHTLDSEGGAVERAELQRSSTATLALYHAAHIVLNADVTDLQIHAGATHILGRPVTRTDRDRSRARIQEHWARPASVPAALAASHGASLLRDGIRRLQNWDAGSAFHYPWCLYLATLACWTVQTAASASAGAGDVRREEEEEGDDPEWGSTAEVSALVSALARSRVEDLWRVAGGYRSRSRDLPRVVAKVLGTVRWAVVQEGMIVLRRVVDTGERGVERSGG